MGRRIQRLERLRRLNARVRAGRSKPKGSKRESSSPAAGKASTESAVKIQVQLQLEKSRNVLQPAATSKRHEELHARSAVKRALPRYARINMLAPGVTWGQVQRHLQETGHIFWRPSLKEKREAARRSAGLKPPDGKKIYYRDVHLPELLVFRPMGQSYTEDVEMFDEGALVFQQKASAFPAIALDPPRGAQVIDACAAPGSKTSQMAAMMCNEGQIFAFDRDGRRLKTMMTLMQQRHVTCVEPAEKDFLKISFKDAKYRNVTHFLLDPSCSSSGMTAQPLTKPAEMQQLAKNQKEVILHAMRFPSCQRIAYSTCSVHEQENEEVVQDVLSTKTGEDFELEEALPWLSPQ